MRKLIYIIIGMLILVSCASVRDVPATSNHTEYVSRMDTLRQYDSVYVHDSVMQYVSADTVYKVSYKSDYRYKLKYSDRIRDSVRVDTVYITHKVKSDLSKSQKFYIKVGKYTTWILSVIIIISILYIFLKVYKKI